MVDVQGTRITVEEGVSRALRDCQLNNTQIGDVKQRVSTVENDITSMRGEISKLSTNLQEHIEALRTSKEEVKKLTEELRAARPPPVESQSSYVLLNTLDKYCGKPNENINFFFKKLDRARELGKWNEREAMLITQQVLAGEAQVFISSDLAAREAATYEELKDILINRFKKKTTDRYYRELLTLVRIKDGEEIEHFADRIKELNSHTFELGDSVSDNLIRKYEADNRAIDSFLIGLGEGELGSGVRKSRPKTFNEAVATAVELQESERRALSKPTKNVFSSPASQTSNQQGNKRGNYNNTRHYNNNGNRNNGNYNRVQPNNLGYNNQRGSNDQSAHSSSYNNNNRGNFHVNNSDGNSSEGNYRGRGNSHQGNYRSNQRGGNNLNQERSQGGKDVKNFQQRGRGGSQNN
jgi:hypothetical protein